MEQIILNLIFLFWTWEIVAVAHIQYRNYEGLGVPISTEILTRCHQPFSDDLFPYFYDGTIMDNYPSALAFERTGCCVTKMEYANLTAFGKKHCKFLYLINSMNSIITWFCVFYVFV